MEKTVLNSKLHRVKVTDADLNYMGSITIDKNFLDYAGIHVNEKVQIVNLNNGARFETYVISGKRDSKTICLNGASARLVQPGDEIIVMSFVTMDVEEIDDWEPGIVFFDEDNNILKEKSVI